MEVSSRMFWEMIELRSEMFVVIDTYILAMENKREEKDSLWKVANECVENCEVRKEL